ncbi:hypothetical protein ES692_09430 [Psychroserpens burtonensis]|uniref:Lipoprotein n=1 Tax=Psychroserpens burtonensis TaxID=49278 RepID=A0A5C7B9X8_9FLAO|nr:hypothetical protein [Psychroserpens burtonensis]TXE17487.1 hypothetical protein ES692_09430 [Psychroserpens burtonensis]
MKKFLLLITIATVIVACNTTKSIEKQVNNGNYDIAINDALRKLSNNKSKKSKQASILLLKNAFNKATKRDLDRISYLKKDANPENFEDIYGLFQNLNNRQEQIKPILPLYYNGKEVKFQFSDYNTQIIKYKEETTNYLYGKAIILLETDDKLNARQAYDDFKYIDKINPNYKDVNALTNDALYKGQDIILITLKNNTEQIIPQRLETDLLNISTYGLNDLWTVYHNEKVADLNYDYNLSLIFKDIIMSPEQIKERQIIQEKLVKDGFKYVLDRNGNVKKDSLGNDIKEDKFTKVTCEYLETRQFKTSTIVATAEYTDTKTKQLIDRFPIESTFLFEHFFATYQGDKRAIDGVYLDYITNRVVPFPNTEQMIFDTGEDLKLRLKEIITRYNFKG